MKHNTTNYYALSIGFGLFLVAVFGFLACGCQAQPPAVQASQPCLVADAGSEGGNDVAVLEAPQGAVGMKSKKKEVSPEAYSAVLEACNTSCVSHTQQAAFCGCICSTIVSKLRAAHPETVDDMLELLPSARPTEEDNAECKKVSSSKK